MKPVLTLLFICTYFISTANPVYTKLYEVNKCWAAQTDIDKSGLADIQPRTETEWIQLHLQLVEKTLRARSTANLSVSQQQNRLAALDHLHEYWQAGSFPQNAEYSYRLPIFIDKYDNFCAVGYLVKATGYEHVSRMISEKTNLAYVKDMNYPELNSWADAYGFTVDELAWIQPSYPPNNKCLPLGKGTNGHVYELFVDTTTQRLYVGGSFNKVDSTISTYNIAYVTDSNGSYTWHAMDVGTGGLGSVKAIAVYNGDVFAGGDFGSSGANVTYWNGTSWSTAGCIDGIVNELIVFQGSLYAAGDFDVCASMADINFAKWTGTSWLPISGLSGHVNTMEVKDSVLFLGGGFKYNGDTVNAIKWDTASGFQTFSNPIKNEVNDFEFIQDTLHAVCTYTGIEPYVIRKLYGNTWDSSSLYVNLAQFGPLDFKTMYHVDSSTYILGGSFRNQNIFGPYFQNNIICVQGYAFGLFLTDTTINEFVSFKGRIFAGGLFSLKLGTSQYYKGIGYYIPDVKPIVPPFISSITSGKACGNNSAGWGHIIVQAGTPPYTYLWSTGDTTATVTNLPAGTYKVTVIDSKNEQDTATVIVSSTIVDTSVTINSTFNGIIMSAKSVAVKHNWLDCDKNELIIGQYSKDFKPTVAGNYAFVATLDGCSDTSACYNVVVKETAINNVAFAENIRVFPNPVTSTVTIGIDKNEPVLLKISDVTGRVIHARNLYNAGDVTFDMSDLANGVYILSVTNAEKETIHYKLMKN